MVEAVERSDLAAARALHHALLPLMTINFVESNPIPVKAAMAAMGLLRGGLPAADGAAVGRRRSEKIRARPGDLELVLAAAPVDAGDRACARPHRGAGRRHGAGADRDEARAVVRASCARRCRRHGARRRARCVDADRLARQHLGQAGHPARVPVRRPGRRVRGPRPLPFYDKDTLPLQRLGARGRRPHRAGRIGDPRRRVPRAAASSACRRCTSTSAPTSARAR